jgi:hypothetical protein
MKIQGVKKNYRRIKTKGIKKAKAEKKKVF